MARSRAARYTSAVSQAAPRRRRPREALRFTLLFALAAMAALAAGTLVPTPAPPRPMRASEAPRPVEDRVVAALDRASSARPLDAEALRRLVEQLRAAHRPLQLAVALERLHALTGESAPLREAMDLRTDLGDFAAARAALERLALLGAATETEVLRIAAARLEGGDPAGVNTFLLRMLAQQPSERLALAAVQSALRLPDPVPPVRVLGERLAALQPSLLEPLRRILLADGRPDLALALMEGLPADIQADGATAFRMAEAEARAGFPGAALARLLALRATVGLPPGAGALLIDLALREDRLEDAFEVASLLPVESWPAGLPTRLLEAARAANRPELLRPIDPQRLVARPDAAAVVALARGDRAAARRFALLALERPPTAPEAARGLAAVLRDGAQDQAAWDRLRRELERSPPDASAAALFAELSAGPPRAVLALGLLERLRGAGPAFGEAWLRLALAEARSGAVAAFLREGGAVGTPALVEALEFAAQRRDTALAEAAAATLRSRAERPPGLPEGWSAEEVQVTAALARPLTPAALSGALDLLGWTTEAEARRRVVMLLAGTPDIGAAAAALPAVQRHQALFRLRQEAEIGTGEGANARLALLAVLAPRDALALLDRRAAAEPARFGPALVLALLRSEGTAAGEAALRALLPQMPRPAQEQTLFLLLAAGPAEARPGIGRLAEQALGPNWRRNYEAALARSGRRADLLVALRARAALPGTTPSERREIAQRLTELGDREGAQAVLQAGEAR